MGTHGNGEGVATVAGFAGAFADEGLIARGRVQHYRQNVLINQEGDFGDTLYVCSCKRCNYAQTSPVLMPRRTRDRQQP
jgi:hypothetical protein